MTDQQTIADKESKQPAEIISYCIEYASVQGDKCTECKKRIIKGSLRAGEIHRKSKSEKKNKAQRTWWHFNCWKVPERLTIVPIEQFRGYLKLKEKDQRRVKRVIDSGVGASWSSINEKLAEENDELDQEAESPKKKDKKKKQQSSSDDIDMTSRLTGVTTTDIKKKEAGKKRKRTEDVLGKEGQDELQSIAKEIQAVLKKRKQ